VKEVSEDALPSVNFLKVRAAPDLAVQKNIDYVRNMEKLKAERERQHKEYLDK